tara:strand:- start:112 stop:843 length:732 start_codon:yes stop_codon:yes gene_type:complete
MKDLKMKLHRQEYKYYISNEELFFLRNSLKTFMKLDENVNKGEKFYTITSLYFDTPYNDNFNEKVDGIYSREKFRIRKYSTSNIIKFESKKKIENVIEKKSEVINQNIASCLINGNFNILNDKSEFLKKSYINLKSRGLRAKNISEYEREAYYLPYGNIRITFDLNLRTYNSDIDFLQIKNSSIPIFFDKINILEIKFSSPLPEHLKYVLSKIVANRCAISKFVLGQKYINFSPWQDKISEPF